MENGCQDNILDQWFFEKGIYMIQPNSFIANSEKYFICKLQKSIYGLKQASRLWNKYFDQAIKTLVVQNEDEPCMYKKT